MYRKLWGDLWGKHTMNIIRTWGDIYLKVFYKDFYILPRNYIERKYKTLYSIYRTSFDI
jgi:hypothetical protein